MQNYSFTKHWKCMSHSKGMLEDRCCDGPRIIPVDECEEFGFHPHRDEMPFAWLFEIVLNALILTIFFLFIGL